MTPLQTLTQLRKVYPTPCSNDQLGLLLNAVAWAHRGEGYGLLSKSTAGAHCLQPRTGISISRDCLAHQPSGMHFDVLVDAEGAAKPIWQAKGPWPSGRVFVTAIDIDVDIVAPPPVPKPATLKPYDDALAVAFGQAVNTVYQQTASDIDAGMIAVQAIRTWHDYQSGMSWPASLKKHVNELRAEYGLEPV